MAEKVFNLYEAKSALSKLVDRAAAGEEIVIAKNGRPMVKIVPLTGSARAPRRPGGWEGRVRIADDFDAPLPPELAAGFAGGGE
jgi:prevent-host-death family protein